MLAIRSESRGCMRIGVLLATALAMWAPSADAAEFAGDAVPDDVVADVQQPPPQVGTASWYGREHAGRRTASGVRFDPDHLTAAHRHLPLGTQVRVTHVTSGRSVIVTINDRGPYVRGRIIDLSQAAAVQLGIDASGTAKVCLEPL